MANYNDDGSIYVDSLNDIKEVVSDFMPGREDTPTPVKAEFIQNGKKIVAVSSVEGISPRESLIEGFSILKKRIDVVEHLKEGAISPVCVEGHMWVDDLIRYRMGGKRDGLKVRWDLAGGSYKFDPFTGKLTKVIK